jgi:hypothetical protein
MQDVAEDQPVMEESHGSSLAMQEETSSRVE